MHEEQEATDGAPGLTTNGAMFAPSNKGIATSSILTTSNKKLLGAPGHTTRSKNATGNKGHRY